jgi:hypothetical protein
MTVWYALGAFGLLCAIPLVVMCAAVIYALTADLTRHLRAEPAPAGAHRQRVTAVEAIGAFGDDLDALGDHWVDEAPVDLDARRARRSTV